MVWETRWPFPCTIPSHVHTETYSLLKYSSEAMALAQMHFMSPKGGASHNESKHLGLSTRTIFRVRPFHHLTPVGQPGEHVSSPYLVCTHPGIICSLCHSLQEGGVSCEAVRFGRRLRPQLTCLPLGGAAYEGGPPPKKKTLANVQ